MFLILSGTYQSMSSQHFEPYLFHQHLVWVMHYTPTLEAIKVKCETQ